MKELTKEQINNKVEFGLSTYELGYSMALSEIEQYIISVRRKLVEKREKQKTAKPKDIATQINIGSKLKMAQQVLDKVNQLK